MDFASGHIGERTVLVENGAKLPTIQDFIFIKPISRGAFGKVFLGHKRSRPEQLYAIKVMKKSDMINKNLTSQVVIERDAMAKSASPFIVNLFYSIQSQQNIFLVMDYLIGGDVKSLLGVAGYFDEDMAVMYIAEVTLALEYLHNKRIIHRDLKPDNMLISDKGHIKLTDFGLSKFNMSFNEVPMTPKTPMPYFHTNYDQFRTPGQIRSLSSALAFSSDADVSGYTDRTGTPSQPLSEISLNMSEKLTPVNSYTHKTPTHSNSPTPKYSPVSVTPKLQSHKLTKHKSMRDMLLTQSTSKYLNKQMSTPVENQDWKNSPVSSLVDSLQASMNRTLSTENSTDVSSVNISDMSSIAHMSRPVGMSMSCMESIEGVGSIVSEEATSSYTSMDTGQSQELSDSVFSSGSGVRELSDIQEDSGSFDNIETGKCHTCHQKTNRERNCSECQSHLKVPSRQEKMTDDTPQMHRTEESVWNSYAAKNLRSLRCGSYSEYSDEDSSNKENIDSTENMELSSDNKMQTNTGIANIQMVENTKERCNLKELSKLPKTLSQSFGIFGTAGICDSNPSLQHKPRRLVKTKSFSYPSDEEESDYGLNRYDKRVQFAKKRGFCNVEVSPVRRTHSADSGLTQEFRLLRCAGGEPLYKRSVSLPRTRIRFHSGHDTQHKPITIVENTSKHATETNKCGENNTTCLRKISNKCRTLSDSDNMATLSADEQRLVEGHSDTSEHDSTHVSENAEKHNDFQYQTIELSNGPHAINVDSSKISAVDSIDNARNCVSSSMDVETCQNIQGSNHIVNKMLNKIKRPFVSSLRSESEERALSLNLSSIHGNDDSGSIVNMDESVFSHESPLQATNTCRTPPETKKEHTTPTKKEETFTPLLPPPPPKTRRPSGKKTPAKLSWVSAMPCSSPHINENRPRKSLERGTSVPQTHADAIKDRVQFRTPDVKHYHTPRTPFQAPLMRSQSFSHAMKTPYRTPKSVRRAPLTESTEEERILGTPDYLAPEILQYKPHGTGVDWWSLGICFFEFLTGVPPFNDQTPELVFENILKRDIPWPDGEEAISENCRDAIETLLTMDPSKRPGARAVRKMAVFKDIDWHNLLDMEAPWVPQPEDSTDTSYFEARNSMQDLFVSDVDF